jgi:hypothetical protein
VLKRTQEHLIVWKYKRGNRLLALLAPSTHLDQLNADARWLDHQLLLLVASLAVVQYSRTCSENLDLETDTVPVALRTAEDDPSLMTALDCISNGEVKEFWRGYVGERVRLSAIPYAASAVSNKGNYQIQFISEIEFRSRLTSWLGREYSTTGFGQLMLRLDEFDIGGITPSCLDNLSDGGSFKDVLKMHLEGDHNRNTCYLPVTDIFLITQMDRSLLAHQFLV